jgi:hypothetical protein
MGIPKFIDKHPAFKAEGFIKINEEPPYFNLALGSLRFRKSAAIISAGEILLFNILPRSRVVVGIDHSYRSIAITLTKCIMLDKLGPGGMIDFLATSSHNSFVAKAKECAQELPDEALKTAINLAGATTYSTYSTPVFSFADSAVFYSVRSLWLNQPRRIIEQVHRRMEQMVLIHGDLQDLKDYGRFDSLYISNALDHTDRHTDRHANVTQRDTMARRMQNWASTVLREDGYLLLTHGSAYNATLPNTEGFATISSGIRGIDNNWQYLVLRRGTTAPTQAATQPVEAASVGT